MNVITVSQLNTYIKAIFDENTVLKSVYVIGEISNFKYHTPSGHIYMTLKDDKSQLKSVMFSSYASRLRFYPESGMRVICRGRVSVYDRDGAYQLYIEDMQPDGAGALAVAFEQLKIKLASEGLFDEAHKKNLPRYPSKIGIATSNTGAAVEDIKNITKRRYPAAELVIVPTIVQGASAPGDIVKSIELLDSIGDVDVIIVGRGGGSLEDLWAFNTEAVARAVYECKTPVISAVGHETDYTICDFAADYRAETPSAAAEKAVPDTASVISAFDTANEKMRIMLKGIIEREMQRVDYIANESILGNFTGYFEKCRNTVDIREQEMVEALKNGLIKKNHRFASAAGRLDALSPLAVLARGYAVVSNENGNFIRFASDLKKGEKIKIKFSDGTADCVTEEVKTNGNNI